MRILLGNYGIKRLDEICVAVFKTAVRKKGTTEEYLEDIYVGYYGSVEGAINGLLKYKLKNSDVTTLKALKAYIVKVEKELKEAIKELNGSS